MNLKTIAFVLTAALTLASCGQSSSVRPQPEASQNPLSQLITDTQGEAATISVGTPWVNHQAGLQAMVDKVWPGRFTVYGEYKPAGTGNKGNVADMIGTQIPKDRSIMVGYQSPEGAHSSIVASGYVQNYNTWLWSGQDGFVSTTDHPNQWFLQTGRTGDTSTYTVNY